MNIHSSLSVLLNAHSCGFELGSSGLRVDGINGEVVRGYLIVKMKSEKSQAGTQARIKSHWSNHRAAARTYAYPVAFAQVVTPAVFGSEVDGLLATER